MSSRIAESSSAIFSAWAKEPRDFEYLTFLARNIERLSTNSRAIQEVIEANVCPILIEIMREYSDSHAELVVDATWIINNITSGSSEQTQYIINLGALPVLKQLLLNPNQDINRGAASCLGNIAADSIPNRDLVIAIGVRDLFVSFLKQNEHVELKCRTLWAISVFFRGLPKLPLDEVLPYLPPVAASLQTSDTSSPVMKEALGVVKNMLEGSGDYMEIVKTNFPYVANTAVSCICKGSCESAEEAICLAELLVNESPDRKQELINAGIIEGLTHALIHCREGGVTDKATKMVLSLMLDSIPRLDGLWSIVKKACRIPMSHERIRMMCKIYSDFIEEANHDQLLQVMGTFPVPAVVTYFIFADRSPSAVVNGRTVMDRLFSKIGINACWDRVSKSACDRFSSNSGFKDAIPRLVVTNVGKEPIDWINLLVAYGFDTSKASRYVRQRIRELNVLTLLVSPTVISQRRKPVWPSRDIWRLFVKFLVVPTLKSSKHGKKRSSACGRT